MSGASSNNMRHHAVTNYDTTSYYTLLYNNKIRLSVSIISFIFSGLI